MSFIGAGMIIGGALSAGGSIYSANKAAKSAKASTEDIRSKDQRESQALLQSLATTGSGGGINLGEQYGGALGNFEAAEAEMAGISGLQNLLSGPEITKARETFTGLTDTKFDPSDPNSGYAEFSRQLARSGKQSEDILNREAAITGNRFGTSIGRNKVDLAERMQDIRGSKLAELFQQSKQHQLAGAQGLSGLFGQQASGNVQLAQAGGLERRLKDQKAIAELNEYKRQRGETLGRVELLATEAGRNAYTGVSSLPGSPSGFSSLVNSVLGGVGESAGSAIGSGISNKIGSYFDKKPVNVSSQPAAGSASHSDILGYDTSQYR